MDHATCDILRSECSGTFGLSATAVRLRNEEAEPLRFDLFVGTESPGVVVVVSVQRTPQLSARQSSWGLPCLARLHIALCASLLSSAPASYMVKYIVGTDIINSKNCLAPCGSQNTKKGRTQALQGPSPLLCTCQSASIICAVLGLYILHNVTQLATMTSDVAAATLSFTSSGVNMLPPNHRLVEALQEFFYQRVFVATGILSEIIRPDTR